MKGIEKKSAKNSISQKSSKKNHLMKSSWNLGKTETMRIPSVLKPHLMEIARHIDNGGTVDLVNQSGKELNSKNSKTILSQVNTKNSDLNIPFSEVCNNSEFILSQEHINKIINVLKNGITSKKQGGVYQSSNANTVKQEVIKALALLEELTFNGETLPSRTETTSY